jgi:hypothetical protein
VHSLVFVGLFQNNKRFLVGGQSGVGVFCLTPPALKQRFEWLDTLFEDSLRIRRKRGENAVFLSAPGGA